MGVLSDLVCGQHEKFVHSPCSGCHIFSNYPKCANVPSGCERCDDVCSRRDGNKDKLDYRVKVRVTRVSLYFSATSLAIPVSLLFAILQGGFQGGQMWSARSRSMPPSFLSSTKTLSPH